MYFPMEFDKKTTLSALQETLRPLYGAAVEYGEYVIAADIDSDGVYKAAVYASTDEVVPATADRLEERAIRIIAESDHEFSDNGNAVKWGFDKIAGMK